MNLILCGLPMSGKTTIGSQLAKELAWNFIDTDQLIEEGYAQENNQWRSCHQIFSKCGKTIFRELEKSCISSLQGASKSVIAVGGGSLNDADNRAILQSLGHVLYLKVPVTVLWERMRKQSMPAYVDPADPEQAFYRMAEKRLPLYEEAAQVIIETDNRSTQEIIEIILQHEELPYGK
jgi:shikimate kinase